MNPDLSKPVWNSPEDKPVTLTPVIVAGVLEYEREVDTHEGYWAGKGWMSVRIGMDERLCIRSVIAWAEMPKVPKLEEIRRRHET